MATGAELGYNIYASALSMANSIFGEGTTVVGASYTGPSYSSAIYTNGDLTGGVAPSNTGVIFSTGDVRNFTQSWGDPNRSSGTSTDTSGINNNSQFNAVAGTNTYDAAWMDVDFIPTGNVMTIQFTFASEEYPEYVASQFNDVVGVWINGSYVPIGVGNGLTSVNNINQATQSNLTVSNLNDAYNTEMDGFTVTLSLTIPVNPGVVNSIRIGIADTSDSQYDSALMIAADSVQTVVVAVDDTVTVNPNGEKTIDVLANDVGPGTAELIITHINGIPVVAGQVITLPSGQQVRLNADGTLTVIGDGDTETVNFTYTTRLGDGQGPNDVGIVTINSIPCFVAGTMILTPDGERPVEQLEPGDLVMTKDDGAQPVRWIGQRRVAAIGTLAPIEIREGTFGPHRRLLVSPQHRVLVRDSLAELLFGEEEVLIAAKDLVNGRSVRIRSGGMVDYFHILFDKHQLVSSAGLTTESFLPGPQTTQLFESEVIEEIRQIFPKLNPQTGEGYSPAVRKLLKSYEAQLLLSADKAA
ncbi:Hint domain-containing protein [Thioclava sp. FR2]|uniref:Hint domain-containing protein n=1 Tax=Thioclava sp. FR2 TaxID=3445780 RepID=UPI003EBBC655